MATQFAGPNKTRGTQPFGNAAAVHSLGHQEYAVQAVVIAGFGTTPDLILAIEER